MTFRIDQAISDEKQDELERKKLARGIAQGIQSWSSAESSLVLAIYGAWGSGKTSLKNLIKKIILNETPSMKVLEYNPWHFKSDEAIASAFFGTILRAIGTLDRSKEKATAGKWKLWEHALKFTGGSIKFGGAAATFTGHPGAGIPLTLTGEAIEKAGSISSSGASVIEEFENEKNCDIDELRDQLFSGMSSLSAPILVFIDDVDRLTTSEIRMLFQLVKSNSDFPNLAFIILCQRNVVEKSLAEMMPKSLSDTSPIGRVFLDKIVHASITVPDLGKAQIVSFLQRAVLRVCGSTVNDTQKADCAAKVREVVEYFSTIRQIHRFESALSFQIGLMTEGVHLQVSLSDLILLEALRQHEPELFSTIASYKDHLIGDTVAEHQLSPLIKAAHFPSVTRAILRSLFPSAFGDPRSPIIQYRVQHQLTFDRYFWQTSLAE